MVDVRPRPARLPALGAATTAVIHENLVVVLTFAFSWHELRAYGGWLSASRWYPSERAGLKNLHRTISGVSA